MIDTARPQFPSDMVRAAHSHRGPLQSIVHDMLDSLRHYARAKPVEVAIVALGVGFFLGWKLKP
jgi:hypothetical protein